MGCANNLQALPSRFFRDMYEQVATRSVLCKKLQGI